MSTKRIPIHRPIRAQIPLEALDLFREMKKVGCACPPIELDFEYIREEYEDCTDGEFGWRLRREMSFDGHDRILLDEAEARALFADYQRRWRAAVPAMERYVAECRAAAERYS